MAYFILEIGWFGVSDVRLLRIGDIIRKFRWFGYGLFGIVWNRGEVREGLLD